MFYIRLDPDKNGYHGNPTPTPIGRDVPISNSLLVKYVKNKGFVNLIMENGNVVDLEPNQDAYDAYITANPPTERRPMNFERIQTLEDTSKTMDSQVMALSDQNDFYEELIVEMANVVYA